MPNLAVTESALELANSTQSTKSTKEEHKGTQKGMGSNLYGPDNESESSHDALMHDDELAQLQYHPDKLCDTAHAFRKL